MRIGPTRSARSSFERSVPDPIRLTRTGDFDEATRGSIPSSQAESAGRSLESATKLKRVEDGHLGHPTAVIVTAVD